MKKHRKALSITAICVMAVLVAWLGATHTIAQDISTKSPAASTPSEPPGRSEASLTRAEQLAQQVATSAEPVAEPVVQDPPAAETVTEIQAEGDVITHWPLQDAPIRLVLRQLAMWGQKNIVASKNVKGTITTDLFNVTFREALNALVRANAMATVAEGNFIYVYTAEELAEMEAAARQVETRVFRLNYVKPEDVVVLITPLLSKAGKVSASPNTEQGIPTSKEGSGGMDYAMSDILVVSDYKENLDEIAQVVSETDVQPVQVLIEATIMVASLDEDNALGIDWSTLDGCDLGASRSVIKSKVSSVVGGFTFEWEGSDFEVFLDAIENVRDINVLANPKLLVVNKMRGEIIVGDELGYQDSTSRDDSGTTTQSVAFLETGTRLVVRPFVGAGGSIRLEIHPEVSDGVLDANQLPQKQTTECTSNVIVQDGHTIVISGMFRERTTNDRQQVPIFGNIPLFGAAFRSTTDRIKREEVIILITPHILSRPSDEATSLALQDEAERFRVGMRQNLNWFGRSRLATQHLNWAKEHLADGRTGWALWDVNMALSMSPANLEAIQLKEHLTGEALWAREARISSSRWIIQTMIMNKLGKNVNMIVPPNRPADLQDLPEDVRDALGVGPNYSAPILPAPPADQPASEPADKPAAEAAAGEDLSSQADAVADEPFTSACEMVLGEPIVAVFK